MTDESWFIIRNTQYVTGIVGSSGQRTKPTPIPEEEIVRMIDRSEKEINAVPEIEDWFKEGELV
jgi:transcriptional antiterminator NusG